MKKLFSLIGAAVMCAAIVIGLSSSSYALDRSYTYNYDFWGDVQNSPDFYTVTKVYTSTELGLEKRLNSPQGIYTHGDSLYVLDTGNNRIVVLSKDANGNLSVTGFIEEFKGDPNGNNTFNNPTDIAISEDGNYFIADRGNSRILKLDKDLNYLMQFDKPEDSSLEEDIAFQPFKIAVDTAERVYAISVGINKGLVKYESDGTFSGFVGATPVVFNFIDYLWKKFATQEQLSKMESFVPTEYSNLYMDYEGFIYAVTSNVSKEDLKGGDADAIRKLNLLGNDILVRNGVFCDGEFPVYGDIYMGDGGGYNGPSLFSDVTTFDNDVYVCLDKNRGRLFAYDDQGKMLFCCGGAGNMDGYFRQPVGLDHLGNDLYVVDQLDCSITVFTLTAFGDQVFTAMDQFDAGEYDASKASWEKVIEADGNYDIGYIGVGRALLREENYKEAMEYFELKYDADNYSKAYKQYRKEWVEDNIVAVVIVILLLFVVPLVIGRIKMLKFQIATSDAFKV